jgi:SAM-dependent methyltransferase
MKAMVDGLTQAELWNGQAGQGWVAYQETLDRAFEPFDRAALQRAAPIRGEHVLEVGCGCGGSTLALAEAVGEQGSVLAVDLSRPMLRRARERTAGRPQVTLLEGDAGRYAFPRAVTLIYSRLGVMFFDEPARAFASLRGALGPGGRLCFVCLRSPEQSPFHTLPLRAAAPFLSVAPPVVGAGPFSLASEPRIHGLLAEAGFADVQSEALTTDLAFGTLEQAVELTTRGVGPLPRALRGADVGTQEIVCSAVREALRAHLVGDEVMLGASAWIVHARRPAHDL